MINVSGKIKDYFWYEFYIEEVLNYSGLHTLNQSMEELQRSVEVIRRARLR